MQDPDFKDLATMVERKRKRHQGGSAAGSRRGRRVVDPVELAEEPELEEEDQTLDVHRRNLCLNEHVFALQPPASQLLRTLLGRMRH